MQRHSDGSITFPKLAKTVLSDGTIVAEGLHPNCGSTAIGSKVVAKGGTHGYDRWQTNADNTISPWSNPSVVLAWGTMTVAPCWTSWSPEQNRLVFVEATRTDVVKFYFTRVSYARVGGQGLCAPANTVGSGFLGDVRGAVTSKQQCFDLCSQRSECIGISINEDGMQCELEARDYNALVAEGIPPGWSSLPGSCQTGCTIAGITDNGNAYECWEKTIPAASPPTPPPPPSPPPLAAAIYTLRRFTDAAMANEVIGVFPIVVTTPTGCFSRTIEGAVLWFIAVCDPTTSPPDIWWRSYADSACREKLWDSQASEGQDDSPLEVGDYPITYNELHGNSESGYYLHTCVAASPSASPTATVITSFSLAGAVEEFGPDEQAAIRAVLATGAGVPTSAVSLTLSPGSVIVTATIIFAVEAAANEAVSALSGANGILENTANLEEALVAQFAADGVSAAGLMVEAIVQAPGVELPGDDDNNGGSCGVGCIIGITVGIAFGVMALVAVSALLFLFLTGAACFKKADRGYATEKPGAVGAGAAEAA